MMKCKIYLTKTKKIIICNALGGKCKYYKATYVDRILFIVSSHKNSQNLSQFT
jgi:hypothetical protein